MIKQMKRAFTYKDLSLIAGIAVALIVVFFVWVKQTPRQPEGDLIHKASFSIPDIKSSLIDRTLAEIIG
jgi:hypothetical protein